MPIVSGTQLAGRYEILSALGAGGMGEVYRARDARLGRDVAIKVLPQHLAADREALSRFEREAKAVAALSHPNILAIHDFVFEKEFSFAVMELLEGETLRSRIKQSAIPWRKVVELGIAIAEGLSAAHSKGVTHRDLKPENIFLTSDGQVKILDFGLARWDKSISTEEQTSAETITRTEAGVTVGTVPYMSPEQLRGDHIDVRSDIFSFGSVLYEMLSGISPFAHTNRAETIAGILKEEPKELQKDIPADLQRIVSHCLEKNPELRFQTARDLTFALKAALVGAEVSMPLAPKIAPRYRVAVWIFALIGLLVTAGSIYFFSIPTNEIYSVAIMPFVNESQNPDAEYLTDGITEGIINSLSQLPKLRVMARDTVFSYKGKPVDARKIGQALKVEAVLTGRLIQEGENLTISAELVDVADGRHIWGERFKRNLADIITIQGEISKEIAENLRLKLTGDQEKRLTKRYTENTEAYRLYLKGTYYWWKVTEKDYEESRKYFEQAIEKDPSFALAYVGLGYYFNGATFDGYLPPRQAWPKAEAAYRKAIELDSSLGLPHMGLGGYEQFYAWNWTAAEREVRLGLRLQPTEPRAHRALSHVLLVQGRIDEAIAEVRKALEMDPLSRVFSVKLGQYLTIGKRYDEAIKQLRQTIESDPNYDVAYFSLADAYEAKGMYQEAAAASRDGYAVSKDDEAAALFIKVKDPSGYKNAMRILLENQLEVLKELAEERYISPLAFAKTYALLGEKDAAFEWLEKAFEERSPQLPFLRVDLNWKNLRSDPRFAHLINRIGLP